MSRRVRDSYELPSINADVQGQSVHSSTASNSTEKWRFNDTKKGWNDLALKEKRSWKT